MLFNLKLHPETPEIASTSGVIDTNGAYSKVELIEPMITITTNIDK